MNPRLLHLKWCRVPQLSSESEVSIALRCQLYSTHYAAFRIKNCSKSTSAIHAYLKKWCHAPQLYHNYRLKSEVSITLRCRLCSTSLFSSTNRELFEKRLCYQIATMTNTDDCHYEGKPSRAIATSTLFAVSKDEWDTSKSMKNSLYVLRYAKRHLSGRSNIEQ